jgi:microcin C transport system permease protein
MISYILRRLLLMIPTLLGIMILNFVIVQAAPGGPVDQLIFKLTNPAAAAAGATARFTGAGANEGAANTSAVVDASQASRSARGIDPEMLEQIKKQFGFDKPAHERFLLMMKSYLHFDFGESFYRNRAVLDLILDKMPVSVSLGLWTVLLMYLISIPLGIAKAMRDGSRFDAATSWIILIGYAIPSFLFGILLIILFAGGSYFDWFPMRGLTSDHWDQLSTWGKIKDYLWHLTLPLTALVISEFASMTLLTKNSFLDELNKLYVLTARAKGLTPRRVLYGHVFRNAMLIVIAGFPMQLMRIFFTGALLIEIIFSLDGLGLLAFESAVSRDYPVMFGTLFIFTLLSLVLSLLSDLLYTVIDPRIDFERRDV